MFIAKKKPKCKPWDVLGRYAVTKHSWRGKYRRQLCITTTSVLTMDPLTQQLTGAWSFVDPTDIDGISSGDEGEFTLSVRDPKDKVFGILASEPPLPP
jgi:DnaJ family protein C protein 13